MFVFKIKINTIEHVKNLVHLLQPINADFDISHNRYMVDAKSIMGIFSMDLSKPVDLVCHTDDKFLKDYIKEKLEFLGLLV